jgi:hypothetical protein
MTFHLNLAAGMSTMELMVVSMVLRKTAMLSMDLSMQTVSCGAVMMWMLATDSGWMTDHMATLQPQPSHTSLAAGAQVLH